ncbi:MAG: hypothetical protein R3B72_04825 [Polyangiaceae bacterium]
MTKSLRWSLAMVVTPLLWAAVAPSGCGVDATQKPDDGGTGGKGGSGTGTTSSSGGSGDGGETLSFGGNGSGGDGFGGNFMNPCDSSCGDTELCDGIHAGLDDDCDGQVDEGCNCSAGAAQSCFKGDPASINEPGCFPGTMKCTELGIWGPCVGGVHDTDNCADMSQGCHPIQSAPFVTADLKNGTGTFSNDAISETFTVACPPGVSPCPAPNGNLFQPLQSGEYTVTYDKTTANGMDQCTFPLFVGAPGLRVELQWEWDPNLGSDTVDLDLHVHKPMDTTPWGGSAGNAVDCAYNNCTAFNCGLGLGPAWFNGVAPPDPVQWYLDPVFENNTCYFGPKGNGAEWQGFGLGCHNPRLDIDNVFCDPTVTDPQNGSFCNPENINIDFPPKNQWTRIGVHYYSEHSQTYPVHPVVKVFCDGQLAAELGNQGFYSPEAPITFNATDGSTRFWLVADVLFPDDECNVGCVVEPLYIDPVAKTPILTTTDIVTQSYGPPYPPIPQP